MQGNESRVGAHERKDQSWRCTLTKYQDDSRLEGRGYERIPGSQARKIGGHSCGTVGEQGVGEYECRRWVREVA